MTATCCDLHNQRCEPPGELCCTSCTEAAHDTFPIPHADGSSCVLVSAEGARTCGCAWLHYIDGQVRYTRRCEVHAPMRRPLERWELDIVRPADRARVIAEHEDRVATLRRAQP